MKYEVMDLDPTSIERFFGTYEIDGLDTRSLDICMESDTIFYEYTGGRKTMLNTANDSILFNNEHGIKISLIEGKPEKIKITADGQTRSGTKTVKYVPSEKDLSEIAGKYWSPELETQYRFYLRDGKLYGYQTRHGEFEIESLKKDVFISSSGFISKIDMVRKGKKVTGMKVTNSRVRKLWLEKR